MSNEDEGTRCSISVSVHRPMTVRDFPIYWNTVYWKARISFSQDPFVELVKGSLNTFLNAMTYPDKTVYPVASCNDKDFQNLMDVYLDGVLHPAIYREPKIFLQERDGTMNWSRRRMSWLLTALSIMR